jgi:hypothetical protein
VQPPSSRSTPSTLRSPPTQTLGPGTVPAHSNLKGLDPFLRLRNLQLQSQRCSRLELFSSRRKYFCFQRSPERNKRFEQAPTSTWLLRSLELQYYRRLHSWLHRSTVGLFDYTICVHKQAFNTEMEYGLTVVVGVKFSGYNFFGQQGSIFWQGT